MNFLRHALFAALAFAFVSSAVVETTDAKPRRSRKGKKNKKKNKVEAACGLSFLPMFEGATWTYDFTTPDGVEPSRGLNIEPPSKVTVTVTKVESRKKSATITLEERHREMTQTTQIKCNEDTVEVSPESFLVSGEVGGGVGMSITKLKRGEFPTYRHTKGKLVAGDMWREDIVATVERKAGGNAKVEHPEAKVEVEREASVGSREMTFSSIGEHPRAVRVDLVITGRASTLEKSVNVPTGNATLWFERGTGLVRAHNRWGQGWQLAETTVGKHAKPTEDAE